MAEEQQEGRSGNGGQRRASVTQNAIGRVRAASASTANRLLFDTNPARGMWVATGQAIAHAPNLEDLRSPVHGGENITFDAHGHSAREKPASALQEEYVDRLQRQRTIDTKPEDASLQRIDTGPEQKDGVPATNTEVMEPPTEKHHWLIATKHGLFAFWKFFITPTGFLITLYGLNVVAWGAMLFFLLLKAAPAMDHPDDGDANSSPRKIWIEIDSQILNVLFCITAWGLAPWRFRDLYWLLTWRFSRNVSKSRAALHSLASKNTSWYRKRERDMDEEEVTVERFHHLQTFTGKVAPATASWKLDFFVWMMVLNTLLQVGMAFMMWHYNRIQRPSWGAGLFIGLGCAVSMFAGLVSWWEGRKIKKIEGPKIIK